VIARIIRWSARRPALVVAAAALLAVAGEAARRGLARDVITDLADPRIAVVADWMGHGAPDVAASVTDVVMAALDGVPGATAVRGSSMSGMAYVDVVLGAPSDLAPARAEILRRIEATRPRLPATARVRVGPEASSTGWILEYALTASTPSDPMFALDDPSVGLTPVTLRRFQDEVLAPALAAVPGVAEVASVGGQTEELLIEVKPDRLRAAGLALSDVVATARAGLVPPRAPAGATPFDALRVQPESPGGGATLGQLARVRPAGAMPNGIVDLDGRGAAVGGVVIARRDADPARIIARVKEVIARERRHLPRGAAIVVVYDRSELAARMERTLLRALAEEVAAVALVVLLFLWHGRSALLPAITLPLVVLATFAAMAVIGLPATIMSVGGIGIALGLAVDADIVVLEACHRALEEPEPEPASDGGGAAGRRRRARVVAAAQAISPAILTSLGIAALTFVPVFAFTGETGRLLRPLALTKTLVVAAAALVTLTLAPALRALALGRGRVVAERDNPVARALGRLYDPVVRFALRHPGFTLATAGLAFLSCLPLVPRLGGEFLPRVDEGDLLFMPTTAPGATVEQAAMQLGLQDQALHRRPEVATVFGKIGRADTATDPAPPSMVETTIRLRPRAAWPKTKRARWYSGLAPGALRSLLAAVWPEETDMTTADLVRALDGAARLPGWTSAWTAPARARLDMTATGVRTPVGIRVVAADPARLDALGGALRDLARALPGTRSAVYEPLGGETRLRFVADPAALARHHVDPAAAESLAGLLLAGGDVGETTQRGRRVHVRVIPDITPGQAEELLRAATVRATPPAGGVGQPVPLALLGRPAYVTVPAMMRSEQGHVVAYVYIDLADGTDPLRYVERARHAVADAITLGPGEELEWTGQYGLMAAGQRRLLFILPLVALSMAALLWLQFRSAAEALMVMASLPFALVGSVWTLFMFGFRMSAPVWVGLLSTLGLAMQTAVVMVVYIDEAFYRRVREGRLASREDIVAAHADGTIRRLRPKLMTIGTMAAGLLPLCWADGAGAEIMRRVAAPMLGGLATSAFLTLEVIPVLYTIWRGRQLERARRAGVPIAALTGDAPPWARR
jgi:Cu(I)/Ag(I) efflux system membrane protein CusA/SilA